LLLGGLLALLAVPSAASASWQQTGKSTVPLYYYQGLTSSPDDQRLYFNGVHVGLYRTDGSLTEAARRDDAIPAAVHVREGYDHIGDISWDAAEGGRILLPLECYYPQAAQDNAEDRNNTCRTGSLGVADPDTLEWRYYVKGDPAEIPKFMWIEVDPAGALAWTSSRGDLLAYRVADIAAVNATDPVSGQGPLIHSVRRLAGAVPPGGMTGAAFDPASGRLFAANQQGKLFTIYSIDLADGSRQVELQLPNITGEAEGIDFFDGLGGTLHWLIQPYNTSGQPTYWSSLDTVGTGALLHFSPAP
jgi:hypothetical protein